MQKIIDNIEKGIREGSARAAAIIEVERILTVRFHAGCENTKCRICFGNNDSLDDALVAATNRRDLDLLGRYHRWLSDNEITPETEHGWWSEEAFNPDNVLAFADTIKV